ncbi:MAG: HEAT repeat domain-containing protein [Acidobacteria bacterium]|nr:HEAT repeat domain-containing protein [Acidobacteriota bacterium]
MQHENPRAFRDPLLYACTHCTTFDPQCEDARAPYLWALIDLTGEPMFYRDGLLAALDTVDNELYWGQIFDLSATFVEQGDTALKPAMYRCFERWGYAETGLSCAEVLVRLDGLDALRAVMKTFEAEPAEDRPWQFGHLLEILRKRDGHYALPPELDRFTNEWRAHEAQLEVERDRPDPPRETWQAIRQTLSDRQFGRKVAWIRSASSEEVRHAADALTEESGHSQLLNLLRLFEWRDFPGSPAPLLALAGASDTTIARRALTALARLKGPEIRAAAMKAIAQPALRRGAIECLAANPETGDYRLLESLLRQDLNDEELHAVSIGARHYIEANPAPEAERTLLLLYENTPCSMCRYTPVKKLLELGRLPSSIREECCYDADEDTRTLVKGPSTDAGD